MGRHAVAPALVAALLTFAAVAVPQSAVGETVPPAQAVADRGVFLEHVPPPAQPAAVCIVDSGVDLNPDTAGEVVYREALDGGDPGDVSPDKHGTLMAMMAAAPINGWGMVGAAPGAVKIVSVRVEEPGETTVPYSAFARGITACKKLYSTYSIKVVSVSFSDSQPAQPNDQTLLESAVDGARAYGMDVLVAAGNDGGAVSSPATYPAVVAVGAGDLSGNLCPFSGRGAGLDVVAPGCSIDGADPVTGEPTSATQAGTSEATALAAGVLADLRSYRADLTVASAEHLLEQSSAPSLDVQRLFQGAALGFLTNGTSQVSNGPSRTQGRPVLRRHNGLIPDVLLVRRSARILIRALNLPSGFLLRVALLSDRRNEFGRQTTVVKQFCSRKPWVVFRFNKASDRVSIVYVRARGARRSSAIRVLRLRSARRK